MLNLESFAPEWNYEINLVLEQNKALCVALFGLQGNLLYANEPMTLLLGNKGSECFLNPSFQTLTDLESLQSLIFRGFITIGDLDKANISLFAHIFRKADSLLVLAGMDLQQVISQNEILHATNQEISKFQRQLIRDKATIEDKSRKLHELNELLEESNKTKDTLLSIIAHDLKNPFSTIIGLSKLLAKNWSVYNPIKVKNFADNIYAVSVQSHNLLDNLLNWARMQTGNFSAQVSRNDTLTMVGGVVISLQEMALSKGIKLETELQEAQFVVADKNMITTVLRNLITNAIKFSFANSTIRIGSKREGENQVFWVADTGMGIDPAELETILEKKMNKSRLGTSNERGTGIGLPLCMDFIKKNGGTFYATSMLGQGSTFYFTLPLG